MGNQQLGRQGPRDVLDVASQSTRNGVHLENPKLRERYGNPYMVSTYLGLVRHLE